MTEIILTVYGTQRVGNGKLENFMLYAVSEVDIEVAGLQQNSKVALKPPRLDKFEGTEVESNIVSNSGVHNYVANSAGNTQNCQIFSTFSAFLVTDLVIIRF